MLTAGRLAAETQVPTDTIRYYESIGLLPPATRSPVGYRLYPRAEVHWLQLIKRAKLLGLSLPEVKDLVDQTFTESCSHLQQALLERIPHQLADIDRRIAELITLKRELVALQDHLHRLGGSAPGEPDAECEDCACVAGADNER
ncbi:MAG: MerR family transcriptional regulator [Dehalococcoidia bacterium]